MKAQRIALVVCGVILMLLGGATATYVGPDDTLMIGSTTVDETAKGQAVRTHPAITDFVNIDLLVRAEAPSGVFLGYAHRVDTTSLLEGRRHWTLTRMSLGNVGGSVTDGAKSSSTKALKPERIVGWLGATSGDSVELTVPLDGEPIDVVAVPTAGDELVRISLGAKVTNLFLSQLGVIGVGLVFIALSFVLGWWVRRKEARAAGHSDEDVAGGRPDGLSDGRPKGRRGESGGVVLRQLSAQPTPDLPDDWRAALAVASAARSGRGGAPAPVIEPIITPEPAPTPAPAPVSEPIGKPAPAPLSVAAPSPRRFKRRFLFFLALFPLARFFRRRALGRRSFFTLLLVPLALFLQSCAVPGPAASNDGSLSRTGLSLAEAAQLVDDPVDVYTPEFTSYPMWALVATADPHRIQLRTRARFAGKWRTEGKVRLAKQSELPESVSHAIGPGPILTRRADEVAGNVGVWWSSGEIEGVRLDGRTKKARRQLLASGAVPGQIGVWPTPDVPLVRMVEVSGGHLLWISHTITTPARYRVTTVAMMGTNAEPAVLGSRLVEVSPAG